MGTWHMPRLREERVPPGRLVVRRIPSSTHLRATPLRPLALLRPFETVPELFCSTAQIFFPEGRRREETGKTVLNPRPGVTEFPVRSRVTVSVAVAVPVSAQSPLPEDPSPRDQLSALEAVVYTVPGVVSTWWSE